MSSIEGLVRKTLHIYDAQEYDRLGEVMHDDVKLTFLGETSVGTDHVRATLEVLYAALPDQTHTIDRITVDEPNDAAAIEMTVRGTHTGAAFPTSFGEIPTTGRSVSWNPGSFIRARDGKVESWTVYLDQVRVLSEFGVELSTSIPAPSV